MYDAKHQEVMKVCQDILTDIQLYDVEVSIGNATSKSDKSMPAMVIKNKLFELADKALYKAKENGRNVFFQPLICVTDYSLGVKRDIEVF